MIFNWQNNIEGPVLSINPFLITKSKFKIAAFLRSLRVTDQLVTFSSGLVIRGAICLDRHDPGTSLYRLAAVVGRYRKLNSGKKHFKSQTCASQNIKELTSAGPQIKDNGWCGPVPGKIAKSAVYILNKEIEKNLWK